MRSWAHWLKTDALSY